MNRRRFLTHTLLAAVSAPPVLSASEKYKLLYDYGARAGFEDGGKSMGDGIVKSSVNALPRSGAVTLTAKDANVTISGKHFKDILGDGSYAIHIKGAGSSEVLDIEITDCLFENIRWAIRVDSAARINIHGNRFVNCGQAIRVSSSSSIVIEHNEFKDIGQYEVLNHGYGAYWAQNAVSFINVSGEGNSISFNKIDNSGANAPYFEDCIAFWNSGGVSTSPAIVRGNNLRGGIPGSRTGCGIIVGDAVGAKTLMSANIKILDNVVVRMQAVGIGVAGGNGYYIANNLIYQPLEHTQKLSKHPHNNDDNRIPGAGITIYDYSKTLECGDIWVMGNRVYAARSDAVANPYWHDKTSCKNVRELNNTWYWSLENSGDLGDHLLPKDMFATRDKKYFSGRNRI